MWKKVWEPYYINIMFHPLPGSLATLISTMHRGIKKGFLFAVLHEVHAASEIKIRTTANTPTVAHSSSASVKAKWKTARV